MRRLFGFSKSPEPNFKKDTWLKIRSDSYSPPHPVCGVPQPGPSVFIKTPLDIICSNGDRKHEFYCVDINEDGMLCAHSYTTFKRDYELLVKYEPITDEEVIEKLNCLLDKEVNERLRRDREEKKDRDRKFHEKIDNALKKTKCKPESAK